MLPPSRKPPRSTNRPAAQGVRHGLARMLSKAGYCSRTQAAALIAQGRVTVNGNCIRDPEYPLRVGVQVDVRIDGESMQTAARRVIALNKPRGLVTTASDDQGRETVYSALKDSGLPWLAPVGRLDKASEGLLLMTNDPVWAAAITEPTSHLDKTYHVQVAGLPSAELLAAMKRGVPVSDEVWRVKDVSLLRHGARTSWLEITLDEGRNRHIRRIMDALDLPVRRLVRTAIGTLQLGQLAKGEWRELDSTEIARLLQPQR